MPKTAAGVISYQPKGQLTPGRQLKGTKAVGGWIWRREGGRLLARACKALQTACDRPGVLASGRDASQPTKALAQRIAWRVIPCRPHGHTGVVAFCVSYNNGEGEIRPQARSADGLVRMCLGPGGNLCCLSGRCPATGRRPPVPAKPIERHDSRRKGDSSCSQARLGEEETKDRRWGRGCVGPEYIVRGRTLGAPKALSWYSALARHTDYLNKYSSSSIFEFTAFLAQMLTLIVWLLCKTCKQPQTNNKNKHCSSGQLKSVC